MYKIIKKIGIDRFAHLGVGSIITFLCVILFSWFGKYSVISSSILISIILSVYKEYCDHKFYNENKDVYDIISTLIGTILTLIIYVFF